MKNGTKHLSNRPLVTNILWLFFDKGYGAILSLYIYALLAKYLGTELFGVWNYILAFSAIIPAFASLGINFIIVRKLNETPKLASLILANSFLLRLIAGVLFSLIIFVIYQLVGINSGVQYIGIVILIFISQIVLNSNIFIFKNEADLNNDKTVIARNIALTLAFGLRYFGIKSEYCLLFFAFTNVIEYLIFIGMSYFFFLRTGPYISLNLKFNKKISFYLLKEGLPLLLSAITVILYLKIDQLIIAFLMDNQSVGIYSAASRITEMLYSIPVVIANVFFPRIVLEKNNKTNSFNLYNKLYGSIIITTLLISVIVSTFSSIIIDMLFGPLFIESTEVLIIYAWSLFFMGLLVSSSKYLLVINKNKIILIRSILGLVSNILLNFILIPMMGIKGAAWATLISYSIAAYFSNIFFKELRPIMISQITSVFYLARNVFGKIKFR